MIGHHLLCFLLFLPCGGVCLLLYFEFLNSYNKYLSSMCIYECVLSSGHELQPTRLLCPWNFSGKNTGVGCHFLFQWIFLAQGSYLCLRSLFVSRASCIGRQIYTTPLGKTSCAYVRVHAKSLQSYQTPCNPMDYSSPGSSVHGIV